MKYALLYVAAALLLSACETIVDPSSVDYEDPRIVQGAPPEKQITWVLVLIDLNLPTPEMTVEGAYDRMDKCFFKREAFIPGYPKPGTQGICIQMDETVSAP